MSALEIAREKIRAALQEYINAGAEPDQVSLVTDWVVVSAGTHPNDGLTNYRQLGNVCGRHVAVGMLQTGLKLLDDKWNHDD